jgi:hypothetical protein
MKSQKNTLIGKTCSKEPIETLLHDATLKFDDEQNTITLNLSKDNINDFVGFVLDIQDEYALVALYPTCTPITYKEAEKKTPTGAYIPKAWELLKYEHILRKHWPMDKGYWSLHIASNSRLYGVYLLSGCCYISSYFADTSIYRLFAGNFTKVPLKQLHIIK